MSPVICQHCANWAPRETEKSLARLGLAVCTIRSAGPWQTFGATYQRICSDFKRATDETILAREKFAASNGKQPAGNGCTTTERQSK